MVDIYSNSRGQHYNIQNKGGTCGSSSVPAYYGNITRGCEEKHPMGDTATVPSVIPEENMEES